MWKKIMTTFLVAVLGVFMFGSTKSNAAASLSLFTPYSGISLTPGESISYNVDVINDSSDTQHVTFSLEKIPKDWDYSIRAGGNTLQQLSVRADSEREITVEVSVPLEVDKGEYKFELVAKGNDETTATLPFLVDVSEKGTFKTEFSSDQPNMEGHADSEFSYSATLKNLTAEEQHYGLNAKAPKG